MRSKTKPEERLRTIVLTLNIGNNDNRCTKKKGSVNLINVPKELGTANAKVLKSCMESANDVQTTTLW